MTTSTTTPNLDGLRKVTRRTAVRRGQVTIVLRDGTTATGQLIGWGATVLEFAPDAATKAAGRFTWQRNTVYFNEIDAVYQA